MVAGGGPVLEQRLQAAVLDAAVLPVPPAPAPAPPAPLQDVRGSADSSLSLATGIGPAPTAAQGPPAGPPLFPGGTWSPLPPGAQPAAPLAAHPSSPPAAELRSPPVSAAPPGPPPVEEGSPGQWSPGASGVPERPTSVRFRPAQDPAGAGASLVKRSASWRGQDSAAAVRFREGLAAPRDSALDGLGQAGPGRGGPSLRDSQRNMLDSVASPQRGLAASHDPSAWQVSAARAPPACGMRPVLSAGPASRAPCRGPSVSEAGRPLWCVQMSSLAVVQDADGTTEGGLGDDDDEGAAQQEDGEQQDDGEAKTPCSPAAATRVWQCAESVCGLARLAAAAAAPPC